MISLHPDKVPNLQRQLAPVSIHLSLHGLGCSCKMSFNLQLNILPELNHISDTLHLVILQTTKCMVQRSAWLKPKDNIIRRKTCSSMHRIVDCKCRLLQYQVPVILKGTNSAPQNPLHSAVKPLRLSIRLRMVRTTHSHLTLE